MNDQTSINSSLIKEVKIKYSVGRGVKDHEEPQHKGRIVLYLECSRNVCFLVWLGGQHGEVELAP